MDNVEAQHLAKSEVVHVNCQTQANLAVSLHQSLPERILSLFSENGASSWLSVLPVNEHGFALHKGTFWDALCLCYAYGWLPSGLPTQCACACGKRLLVQRLSSKYQANCALFDKSNKIGTHVDFHLIKNFWIWRHSQISP